MTTNIKREISRNVPRDISIRFTENITPLLTAFGCVLMERDTGKSYIYSAVNLKSGKREVISRRPTPLTTSGVDAMVEKMRLSKVAGAGRLEADRQFGDKIALENCCEMLNAVFKEILPQCGYAIRKEQVSLANHILEAISRRSISIAEAEVGTGKTLAYLVAAIIAKRGRLNGYWNMSFYTGTPYVELANMPIVIATSSIALQKALVSVYIPELSEILMEHGVIKTPITAALRKGREHYICERNLKAHIPFEKNPDTKRILEELLMPSAQIDIAEIDGINAYTKRKICVPDRCDMNCPQRKNCAYLRFHEQMQSPEIDIQVCNHNYLLADTLRRRDDKRPLIPNYQMIVIDEAHKFLQAARSMYGTELSSATISEIYDIVFGLKIKSEEAKRLAERTAKKLYDENNSLFHWLMANASYDEEAEDEPDRFTALIDNDALRHLRNIRDISERLTELLTAQPLFGAGSGYKSQVLWELARINKQAAMLLRHNELICWIENDENENRLCAIPKDLDNQLYNDFWSKGIPTILTSGTLSASGAGTSRPDFSRIKRALGMEREKRRIFETSKPSPFNYRENAIIYISKNVPFPDRHSWEYIFAASNEIEQLIYAAHGHTAVLFTSYKVMDMVWEHLEERGIPFPMFRLGKGSIREIELFKQSGNGVLFAAGALWEGIDIPGDGLSLVIIVKLPFAVPDPISEYEQTLYRNMNEYKELVIKPDMAIRLKQGSGRVLRTEKDTGAIAIIDIRASEGNVFHEFVIGAMPKCHVTHNIEDMGMFMRLKKKAEYFKNLICQ